MIAALQYTILSLLLLYRRRPGDEAARHSTTSTTVRALLVRLVAGTSLLQ